MRLEAKPKVLVVDDTVANLKLLQEMLRGANYDPRPCPNGAMALRAAKGDIPDIILLDINMPDMDGFEVCRRLKADEALADIPVIFISALNETSDKLEAFRNGGVDYITKPFNFEEVQARIEAHVTLRRFRQELHMHNTRLSELVEARTQEVLSAKEEVSKAQLATIMAMCKIAEARDDDTGKHIERTQLYCRVLAEHLAERACYANTADDEFIRNVHHASPLHDIGKVAIPDAILNKPGRLTPEEFDVMKTHAGIGADNLAAVFAQYPHNSFIRVGIEIARHHHEKWNGRGYPDGLSRNEIPLSARIMAVGDVYDALRSRRCYKEPFPHEKARSILLEEQGEHFDPELIEVFLAVEDQFIAINDEMGD
jgi:putative two-component system response regulator